jgi:hypothetical protein
VGSLVVDCEAKSRGLPLVGRILQPAPGDRRPSFELLGLESEEAKCGGVHRLSLVDLEFAHEQRGAVRSVRDWSDRFREEFDGFAMAGESRPEVLPLWRLELHAPDSECQQSWQLHAARSASSGAQAWFGNTCMARRGALNCGGAV